MARKTGKEGAVLLGATPTLVAALRRWEYEENDVDVDATAAGDDWNQDESLRGNYEINFEALLEIASTYVIPNAYRGLNVAWVLKVDDDDTNGLLSGSGKFSRLRITTPYDGMITLSGMIKAYGTAPVWDLSPAS